MDATSRPALLVVGMQNDKAMMMNRYLIKENRKPTAGDTQFVKAVNMCIDLACERGWLIIYAKDLHHPRHCSFQDVESRHCVLGSWGSVHISGLRYALPGSEQLVRGLDMDGDSNDAYYVTDPSYSKCTKESSLKSIMAINGLTTLLICGLSPEGCIEQTAATATRLGHNPIIISDCTVLATTPATIITTKPFGEVAALFRSSPLIHNIQENITREKE
jgi:nicotinamidase-related amidase